MIKLSNLLFYPQLQSGVCLAGFCWRVTMAGGNPEEIGEDVHWQEVESREGGVKQWQGGQDLLPIERVLVEEILQIELHCLHVEKVIIKFCDNE